ncbi:ParA family protein [Burkholderia lata]|uniref:Chromosome partitioning protein ParA n=1 Tax=Burkholderia lata (strain ATCC 17760 / DSM 23089 / LMG 22485 / NCIMB 9086 / R18194 / 383) TaxID=482957 RepID=A0A6P2UZJ1_BURL3|nr:AAA family ATPase [Burkholderia lata]VWC79286.1 chromosome partitioning protein ParA [Burkholderia lata]
MAKRISVINFKGGVGKTTFSFHFAAGLARFHKARVLMVDMDHQSSLSIVSLTAPEWANTVAANRTVNEIFKPFIEPAPLPDRSIITRHAIKQSGTLPYQNLDILPASLQLDDIEIELTASHQGNAVQSEWNKRTLICRWLEEAEVDDEYDYIIFDCPPATKLVSQNAIAASHGFIVPVIPEAVMERGAPHLVGMIANGIDQKLKEYAPLQQRPRKMYVPDTKLVGLVVTRIQTHGPANSGYLDDHTTHLASLQRRWKDDLLTPYIEQGTGISQSLAANLPVYDRAGTQNVGNRGLHTMYKELTDNLKSRVDAL